MPKLKLTYFDFHGGRGEPARLALSIGGIPFEDDRVAPSDWPSRRHCHVKSEICGPNDHGRNGSRGDCRLAPCQHSLIAKHAQGSAGGQMALDVEHIVDGGVD
jgi:hypothetical protein